MTWFQKEMDYARESLEKVSEHAINRASSKLNETVESGIAQASSEIRDIVTHTSQDIDAKLDKISTELHNQRQFTKTDVKELVDYAAEKLGETIDQRIAVASAEITSLVQAKVEYFKQEIDQFFIKRQQDLARERRRLFANILIAILASVIMGAVSLFYHRTLAGTLDMYAIFRAVFLALAGGYAAYLLVKFIRSYRQMSEHKKDLLFLTMRYWGVLRPEGLVGHILLILILVAGYGLLFYPEWIAKLTGSPWLLKWLGK